MTTKLNCLISVFNILLVFNLLSKLRNKENKTKLGKLSWKTGPPNQEPIKIQYYNCRSMYIIAFSQIKLFLDEFLKKIWLAQATILNSMDNNFSCKTYDDELERSGFAEKLF